MTWIGFIHDTVNQTSLINGTCSLLKKNLHVYSKEEILSRLDRILEYNKNINNLIDKFYKENKIDDK